MILVVGDKTLLKGLEEIFGGFLLMMGGDVFFVHFGNSNITVTKS